QEQKVGLRHLWRTRTAVNQGRIQVRYIAHKTCNNSLIDMRFLWMRVAVADARSNSCCNAAYSLDAYDSGTAEPQHPETLPSKATIFKESRDGRAFARWRCDPQIVDRRDRRLSLPPAPSRSRKPQPALFGRGFG